ncbi:MAG: helix-turn-helix domain-containing protein [Rhodoglobus sp.]
MGYLETIGDAPDDTFASSFKTTRLAVGQSQEHVATAMSERGYSFHVTTIGKIERGDRKVTVGEAVTLADVLGVSLDTLLVGGQEGLQVAYAAHSAERRQFDRQVQEYTLALLRVATAADNATVIREVDQAWLDSELQNQSPAQSTIDSAIQARAALSRDGIAGAGYYVKMLLDALDRDNQALEVNRVDGTNLRALRAAHNAQQEAENDG